MAYAILRLLKISLIVFQDSSLPHSPISALVGKAGLLAGMGEPVLEEEDIVRSSFQ